MRYFIFPSLCISCKTKLALRQFCVSFEGGVMIVGWCPQCREERSFTTDMATLKNWAYCQTHPIAQDDVEFLRERGIKWEDDATGHR